VPEQCLFICTILFDIEVHFFMKKIVFHKTMSIDSKCNEMYNKVMLKKKMWKEFAVLFSPPPIPAGINLVQNVM